jgi:hypothetical protein
MFNFQQSLDEFSITWSDVNSLSKLGGIFFIFASSHERKSQCSPRHLHRLLALKAEVCEQVDTIVDWKSHPRYDEV